MSFWESDLGKVTGDASDAFAKSFKIIPDQTMALAKIDTFKNVENNGFKYIAIEWLLTDGDFKGNKVTQKLKVYGGESYDKDPERTRLRSLNMFKLLYQLFGLKPKHPNAPTDADLAVFIGKQAGIKIRETEPNDEGKQYNWVAEVHEAKGFVSETGVSVAVTHVNKPASTSGRDDAFARNPAGASAPLDDDIPF